MIRKSEGLKEIVMEKNNSKPKLRFPGFNEPWEQRKLSEISDKVTEKNTENFYDETLTNSAEFGIVTQRDFFDKDISNSKNLNGYYVVQNDDFVYNPRISNFAPVGPIKRNKLARTGVMSPLYYVFRTHDIDKTYLERYFDTTCWHSFMKLNGDSGARADRFAIKDSVFIEMPIPFPSLEEQKKIGKFFNAIINLITLHQRKLNHLQNKKKSLLQKMFPKNDKDFPELRFPGFTDPWEQRKLRQLANFAKGQGYSKNDLTEVGTPIILYGRLYTKYQSTISEVDTFVVPKSGSVYSTGEEVIVPASGETAEDIARASAIVKSGFLLGGDLNIIYPNKDISTIFLALSISNGKQQKELSKKAQGKSVVHLNNSDLEDIAISFPCREEQTKIEIFFQRIDNLITLHQRKLNHLQQQKKALLQQMFV